MVMSAKADLTPACRALRPAVSQTLQQSASAEDQLHLAFSRGHLSKIYSKKKEDIMLQQRHVTRTLSLLVVIISVRVQKGEQPGYVHQATKLGV